MSTTKTTHEYRFLQCFPIIKAYRDNGMSVRAWCKQNDVDKKRFYYWQSILRKTVSETLPTVQPYRLYKSQNKQLFLLKPHLLLVHHWLSI